MIKSKEVKTLKQRIGKAILRILIIGVFGFILVMSLCELNLRMTVPKRQVQMVVVDKHKTSKYYTLKIKKNDSVEENTRSYNVHVSSKEYKSTEVGDVLSSTLQDNYIGDWYYLTINWE